jgi:hypothetical protein
MPGTDINVLHIIVGQPGIYIEKGRFGRGRLLSLRTEEHGYLEILIEVPNVLKEPLALGSVHYDLNNGALMASGYATWVWIYDDVTIRGIEEQIAEEAVEGDRKRCYQIANEAVDPTYRSFRAPRARPAITALNALSISAKKPNGS